ncbi:MAG: bacteriocin transport accessory protein [Eubacteriales bacterium]|nr:bacteriocin transport accessory protein [Eubacteriales bacterium]
MRKFAYWMMTGLMLVAMSGCGTQGTTSDVTEVTTQNQDTVTEENNDNGENEQDGADISQSITDGVSLLTSVWATYEESEKFAVAGGDFSEENQNMEGPGKYGLADAEAVDASLGFPAAEIGKVDDAASLTHMMNANSFTCAAFHVTDAGELDALVTAVKDNILNRQWMCGCPDKVVVITVDDYIVSMFGLNENVDVFVSKLQTVYPSAKVLFDVPVQ